MSVENLEQLAQMLDLFYLIHKDILTRAEKTSIMQTVNAVDTIMNDKKDIKN
jgi:hypothetical protein